VNWSADHPVICFFITLTMIGVTLADEVPLGDAASRPTPSRPIGWRGDGPCSAGIISPAPCGRAIGWSVMRASGGGNAIIRFYDFAGRQQAENHLGCVPRSAERDELISGWRGSPEGWHDDYDHGSFRAVPFFHGRPLYIRSRDELFRVGPRD